MTTRLIVLTAALASGCFARLGDGQNGVSGVDAAGGGGGGSGGGGGGGGGGMHDASISQPDAPSGSACGNHRMVYLSFEGVTLTYAATSDSTQNYASWINNTTSVVPPWHDGSGTRTTDIQTIVDGVKSRLANTPITVVTTRPASGPYVMIAFGGQKTGNGGTVGTIYGGATNEHDCGDLVKNDIGWVSDGPSVSYAQDLAIGAIGWGLGLNGTNDPTDCMCAWSNNCSSANGACTLSSSIATTTSASPATTCPNQNPQNEVAAFTTRFCQ